MNSDKDLTLYTAPTMNGWKPLIFLHEAQLDYELVTISFAQNEQKQDWYLELNPNGRIPTLVDHTADEHVVFESGAILWYLANKYERFLSRDERLRSETLQWLMFQMSAIGPMMGQAMYFERIARPQGIDAPFALTRYIKESRRLLEVLDRRLSTRSWLVGEEYSIADMATYPWARTHFWANVSIEGLDALEAWLARLDARPKTQAALSLPYPRPELFGRGDVSAGIKDNAASFRLNADSDAT